MARSRPQICSMSSNTDYPMDNLPVSYTPPDERRFWRKVRRVVARVPFVEDLLAAYYCAVDRNTPTYVRGVLLGAVAYFVLPADMIPDQPNGANGDPQADMVLSAGHAAGERTLCAGEGAARGTRIRR